MQDTFDIFEFVRFVRARWKFPMFACGIALTGALAAGFLLPKRYTATSTVLIDPPSGGDPRIATAVSNVYLESLKTYELLAANDQLFLRAFEQFHVHDRDTTPIDSLKRRVLKVNKLRDTRALQISVTMGNPQTAQAMAQFIAAGAVELSRSSARQASEAMIADAAGSADAAKARLDQATIAWEAAAGVHSTDALRSELSDDGDLKSRVAEQLLNEQAGLAELESRQKQSAGTASSEEADIGASRARVSLLAARLAELDRGMKEKSSALALESARQETLESALASARSEYDTARQRLTETRLSVGSRNEWLHLVDPGVVPQRPSWPNTPLILIASLSLALFGSLLYLTISFGLARGPSTFDGQFRMATHGDD